MTFYSQHGEDVILNEVFKNRESGFFIEVGCIDGRRFSNTLFFEEQGWRGICVEAHGDYIDAMKRNRPGSVVVHCAVGDEDADHVTFYANSRGTLSTLDPSQGKVFAEQYGPFFTGFQEQQVPCRTISRILDDCGAKHVDLLSVDIEGTEVAAIRGLDLSRHRPTVIVIESNQDEQTAAMDAILLPAGYERGFAVSTNQFYFLDHELLKRVKGRTFDCVVTHTRHPLDDGDDQIVHTTRRT